MARTSHRHSSIRSRCFSDPIMCNGIAARSFIPSKSCALRSAREPLPFIARLLVRGEGPGPTAGEGGVSSPVARSVVVGPGIEALDLVGGQHEAGALVVGHAHREALALG